MFSEGPPALRTRKFALLVVLAFSSLLTVNVTAFAQPRELLVKFSRNATPSEEQSAVERAGGELTERLELIDGAVVELDAQDSYTSVESKLEGSSKIAYAEPNYQVHTEQTPNDPSFSTQWALQNTGQSGGVAGADIGATTVWDSYLSTKVNVAVLDTGIAHAHPDLNANMWTNAGEVPSNGLDEDSNGEPDDYYGIDIVNSDGNPNDDNATTYHGSHVAGTIGAVGNNGLGISGVNWTAKLMAVKVLDAGGSGSYSDIISGVQYANDKGAKVINASFGGSGYSQALKDAIAAFGDNGGLFVAAAGNSASNNDSFPSYPASFDLDNVVSVAASTRSDGKASFSSYGPSSVDLAAPGQDILSSKPPNTVQSLSGTSMAAPHVVGAAALYMDLHPGVSPSTVRQALIQSARPLAAFSGLIVSGGRLDFPALLGVSPSSANPAPGDSTDETTAAEEPKIELVKAKRRKGKLKLSGKITPVDGGSLTVVARVKEKKTVRRGGHTFRRTVTKTVRAKKVRFNPAAGTWSAELKVPRSSNCKLIVRFSGTSNFKAKTLRQNVQA